MHPRACRCAASLFIILGALTSPSAAFAAQPGPDLFENLESLESIPAPAPLLVRPRVFAAYGALIAASMLSILYLYPGRAFIVYWIGSWLLVAGSLTLLAQGYARARVRRHDRRAAPREPQPRGRQRGGAAACDYRPAHRLP